jgi:Tfp pilus assembly protein PilN
MIRLWRQRRSSGRPPLPALPLTTTPAFVPWLRAVQVGLVVILLASTGVAWWGWEDSLELEQRAAQYEATVARTTTLNQQAQAQLARDGLTLPGDQIALVQGKIAFANLLAEKRAFSWTRLLSELEETVPAHVSIGSVKLDVQQARVVVDGLAGSLQDVNVFVQLLQNHRAFHEAVLAKHEIHKGRDGRGGTTAPDGAKGMPVVEFTLAVGYRAAVLNGDGAQ